MIAKKGQELIALHDMMREGLGRKHYRALVAGDWVNDRQHLRAPLARWLTASGERRVRVDPQEGKQAHTIVTLQKRYGAYSLLGAELRTGRTHQIRVHLARSEEHTSELQSLMRISYAVFCLKKKKIHIIIRETGHRKS